MRVLTIFRPLVVAVALSAPLAQVALAAQTQQALLNQNAATASFVQGSPYNNDTLMSPAVGD
jgi:hypothetical protein